MFYRYRLDATRVYLVMELASVLSLCLVFTSNSLYEVTVAGLAPLQLVLIGTTLEVSTFLFEVPTGIVADVYSRRLSIIIGPTVLLRGLAECLLSIDDSEIRLGKGEVRSIPVADRSRLTIPDTLDVEITAGSSIEGMSRKVDEAREGLDNACATAGVKNPDEARKAFEERRDASRHVETKGQVEEDNLRDLAYEHLERKVLGLQRGGPDYLAKRGPEPVICPDFDSAKKEWA